MTTRDRHFVTWHQLWEQREWDLWRFRRRRNGAPPSADAGRIVSSCRVTPGRRPSWRVPGLRVHRWASACRQSSASPDSAQPGHSSRPTRCSGSARLRPRAPRCSGPAKVGQRGCSRIPNVMPPKRIPPVRPRRARLLTAVENHPCRPLHASPAAKGATGLREVRWCSPAAGYPSRSGSGSQIEPAARHTLATRAISSGSLSLDRPDPIGRSLLHSGYRPAPGSGHRRGGMS